MRDRQNIGILRECQRCHVWRSIDRFDELARVCRACIFTHPYRVTGYIARARSMVLTPKARAYLAAEREAVG